LGLAGASSEGDGSGATLANSDGENRAGPGALIVGGDAYGALATARSLGRRGAPIWLVAEGGQLTKFSRYATRSLTWGGPAHEGACEWLLNLAECHGLHNWTLYAGGDEEVRLIAQNHKKLGRCFRLTTPTWAVARFACDKRLTFLHASAAGVDIPWTRIPADRDEAASLETPFPAVLKPAFRTGGNPFADGKGWRVKDRASLIARYDQAAALVGPGAVIIQELTPNAGGTHYSYAAAWRDGEPVAALVARRLRQYPKDLGEACGYVQTVEQEAVTEAARRFLQPIRYSGLVEAVFLCDARDQRYKLLDVAPGLPAWIGLADAAGVDLPSIVGALGRRETVVPSIGRLGVGWLHATSEGLAVIEQIAHGEFHLGDWRSSLSQARTFAAFAPDDPLPALVDLPLLVAHFFRRRLWRRRSETSATLPGLSSRRSIAAADFRAGGASSARKSNAAE
jgi:D-aspartate ligase